jgi:purine-binding chemotaxis protein CheW
MTPPFEIVRFSLAGRPFGLLLSEVERVVRMVEITPLPAAPGVVKGVIDVAGEVVPVFEVRTRFGLPAAAPDPSQSLILARTARRRVALGVDGVDGVQTVTAFVEKDEIRAPAAGIAGVVQTEDGLILIQDLEGFLVPQEEEALARALAGIR